jgi:hypothetical protein
MKAKVTLLKCQHVGDEPTYAALLIRDDTPPVTDPRYEEAEAAPPKWNYVLKVPMWQYNEHTPKMLQAIADLINTKGDKR